jgi:serine/threonine protein phosphatase PrpC
MMTMVKNAYHNSRWVRAAAGGGLIICGILLYIATGGFPPWAWQLLWQALPAFPSLFTVYGISALLSLLGLILHALAVFVLWAGLITAYVVLLRDWWNQLQQRQRFAREIEAAKSLAEHILQEQQKQQHREQGQLYDNDMMGENQSIEQKNTEITVIEKKSPEQHKEVAGQKATLPPSTPARRRRLHLVPYPVNGRLAPQGESTPILHFVGEQKDDMVRKGVKDTDEHISISSIMADIKEQKVLQPLRLAVGAGSDPGIVRSAMPNEDNLLALQATHLTSVGLLPVGLFVVADGMGGHAHGREASRVAIQSIGDVVAPVLLRPDAEEELYSELLRDGVQRANFAIYQRNRRQSHMMGTTLTAAIVFGHTVHVVNVGDSRTYLYQPDKGLMQITRDHSIVARLVEKGIIAPEDVYSHPRRNQIYRCLGENPTVELDSFKVALMAGGGLLLCSDGLWEMVHDDVIERIFRTTTPDATRISTTLMQSALDNGGTDNVSVLVVCAGTA